MSSSASSDNSESESQNSSSQQSSSAKTSSNSSQSRSKSSSKSSVPSQILKGLNFDSQSIRLSEIGRNVDSIARENNQFCNQLNRQQVYFMNGYNNGLSQQSQKLGFNSLYQNNYNNSDQKQFNYYGKYRFEDVSKIQQQSPLKSNVKQNIIHQNIAEVQLNEKKCPECLDRSVQANFSRAPTNKSLLESSPQKQKSIDVDYIPIELDKNSTNRALNMNNSQQLSQSHQNNYQLGRESKQIINNYYKQVQDKSKHYPLYINIKLKEMVNLTQYQKPNNQQLQNQLKVYDEYQVKKQRAISMYQDDFEKYTRHNRSTSQNYRLNKSRVDSESIDQAIKILLNK